MKADIIVGLSYGDEGKGKVTNTLLKTRDYTRCVRFNGSHNAGHTIYKNGNKMVTHAIPTGVIQGIKSIIGPGCVINLNLLEQETKELESYNINVRDYLFIDKRVHVITEEHITEDSKDSRIGTTKKGNGPAYRDKYDRMGLRFEDVYDAGFSTVDIYEELFESSEHHVVLFEGAQGFNLDIDWGEYPYVTSSHCTTAGAMINGIPPQAIRRIYGVTKAYDTYVGAKEFEPNDNVLARIREVGNEFGATTGRPRQVNFLNLDSLVRSIRINGVTDLIINKVDILRDLDVWIVIENNQKIDLKSKNNFTNFIKDYVMRKCKSVEYVKFSFSPDDI